MSVSGPIEHAPLTDGSALQGAARHADAVNAALLDCALDCIVTMDHEGRITEFNPAAERTFGYRRDEVLGRQLSDVIIPPSLREAHRRGFTRYLSTGESRVLGKRMEMTAMRKDGSELLVELAIARIPLGGAPSFAGYLRDITDRRHAEDAQARQLRDSALRAEVSGALARADTVRGMLQGCAEALVRHLDVAFARIWTLPGGGNVLTLEASAGLYTHLDGRHGRVRVGELKIGLIAQERRPHLTNDVASDPRVGDKAWAAREGIVAFAGYPLLVDDRVVGVMAMFARHPLTAETLETLSSIADAIAQGIERKRSQDALRRSEAYLVEGQRLSQTGSWAWNPATGALFWSREMFRIYGFDPAEPPPPYDALRPRVHPADLPAADQTAEQAVRDLKEFDMGYRVVRPDGSVTHIRTVGHPVLDATGNLLEFIGTVVDVTEYKRAERRLRRAIRARYRAVLEERTRLAREMHDGLLQDVTGIALQLRALLPHVRSSPDEATASLQRILELAERTSREARSAVVGMRSTAATGDLAGAVERVARQTIAREPVVCSLTVTGRPRPVRPNVQDEVVRLVREAVTNVVKHADARTVLILVAFRARGFRISVSDDGRGFSVAPEQDAWGGHFGLIGMRERAEGMGASLDVRSAPGRGTTVTVDVPYRRS